MLSVQRSTVIILFFIFLTQIAIADDIIYTDKEIIRNGDFKTTLYTAWHEYWCDVTSFAGKDEGNGLRLEHLGVDDDRYAFQKLTIPSELNSAKIRFDYRAVEDIGVGVDNQPVVLQVSIVKSKGFDSENLEEISPLIPIDVIYTERIEATFDWLEYTADLDQSVIEGMQAAHDAGEFVFLQFSQIKTGTNDKHGFITDIDNVSFKVSGKQKVPQMHGRIAYLEETDDGDPYAISTLDPNTNSVDTIWTHPDGKFDKYSNLAWKPDATELAFISDHDFNFSIFRADIFAIKPDGSALHRIPNNPLQDEIKEGNYPKVTVTGAIQADSGDLGARYSIIMGIQGTDKGKMLIVSEDESVSFNITDVPVLDDPNIFNQPIIMQYSGGGCSAGIEYAFPVGAVSNGSVDLGTIKFFASNCIGILTGYRPSDLSWKHDGSEIGFSLLGLRKFPVEATNEFEIIEIEPGGSGLSGHLAWSPVDNRYLYEDFRLSNTNHELYIAEEGGEPRLLIEDYNGYVTPAWLPDGSGFIYVGIPDSGFDDTIYQYDLATGQTHRLTYFKFEPINTVSISPDGRHIVFEMHDGVLDPNKGDLWIMDRLNPVEMWPITDSGNCSHPDWSRKDVVLDSDGGNDGNDGNDGDGSGGSGGSGGCFISAVGR